MAHITLTALIELLYLICLLAAIARFSFLKFHPKKRARALAKQRKDLKKDDIGYNIIAIIYSDRFLAALCFMTFGSILNVASRPLRHDSTKLDFIFILGTVVPLICYVVSIILLRSLFFICRTKGNGRDK